MNDTTKTATAFDMLLEIYRTRQHRYDTEHDMAIAYGNAADMLEAAMADNFDILKEYEGDICAAMRGLTVDEYHYLKQHYEAARPDSLERPVLNDLLENHRCRVGQFVMSQDIHDPDYEWHLGCPGNMLMVKGDLAMVLDIFMMIVHRDANEGGIQE